MKKVVALIVLVLIVSCAKTYEKHFTAVDICKPLLQYNDPSDPRDEYDNCVIYTDDELKDAVECEKRCRDECDKKGFTYDDIFTDFTGCHCYCLMTL